MTVYFFFQAEDGIRDIGVTGVQTCALPISNSTGRSIYIQTTGFSGQDYWSVLQGGQRLPVDNTCEVCDCSGCPMCAVCGRAIAHVTEMMPGERHQWTWDGRIWQVVSNGCRP